MMRPQRGQTCPSPAMISVVGDERTSLLRMSRSVDDRCCRKSLFASLNTNSPSRRRGDLINVWAEASQSDELAGDFGNWPWGHIDEQSSRDSSFGGKLVARQYSIDSSRTLSRRTAGLINSAFPLRPIDRNPSNPDRITVIPNSKNSSCVPEYPASNASLTVR
jgi:hypothetical protein